MTNFVNISPEKLLQMVNQCLENIENYNGEDDEVITCYDDWVLFKRKKTYINSPRWVYKGCGIIARLEELKNISENVLEDGEVVNRDIKLSLTSYNELFKLLIRMKDLNLTFLVMGIEEGSFV